MKKKTELGLHKTNYIFRFIILSHVHYKTFNQMVKIKDLK